MLIIFDCDGVLRSVSWQGIYEAYLAIASHTKKDPRDLFGGIEDFKKWYHSDWKHNLERMGITRDSDFTEINRIFHVIYDPYIHTFPWVESLAESLSRNHRLAVLSSSSASSVSKSLESISKHLDLIIGLENVSNIKPDPEGVEIIVKKLGANSSETMIIGDAPVDIIAGKRAGIRTAGVMWGLTESEEDFSDYGPDQIFKDPQELFGI